MTKLSMADEIKLLIREKPGINSAEMAEFFEGIPNHRKRVSATLSYLYGKGGYRREADTNHNSGVGKARGKRPFRYWPDAEARPEPVQNKPRQQTANGAAHDIAELKAKVAELEAWKAAALKRHPDLAVDPLVLRAREIVAEELREGGDIGGAKHVLEGQRDGTPILKAVVRALEATS